MSATRSTRGQRIAGVLARRADAEIAEMLANGEHLGTGIGGSTARVDVDGTDIFVKQVPLSTIEMSEPASTANYFHLPVSCHYGIGSPGFGFGRELAAHELTSRWVHDGATDIFPLLLHWRVLEQRCHSDTSEFEGLGPPRRWGQSWPQVLNRVDALRHAEASAVLFLEHVPDTLDAWLRRHFATDSHAAGAAFADALDQISSATTWMRAHGLLHLDVHPKNILVSEGRLLFTDFGLSMHRGFELDHGELAFYATHGKYDHDVGVTSLLHWTLAELGAGSRSERLAILRAAAVDSSTEALAGVRARLRGAADLIAEHAATAIAVTVMFDLLMTNAATASYDSPACTPRRA